LYHTRLHGNFRDGDKQEALLTYFSWASVIFALLAALFWGASALVNLPTLSGVIRDIDNLGPFHSAMKKVGKLNAVAAGCAFISALSQAITLTLTPLP
jgi:hypothetical protein